MWAKKHSEPGWISKRHINCPTVKLGFMLFVKKNGAHLFIIIFLYFNILYFWDAAFS